MHNGEVNAKKLDNQVHQIEVYFRIQNIDADVTNTQPTSLCMEGATLIWWESKTQEDLKKTIKWPLLGIIL